MTISDTIQFFVASAESLIIQLHDEFAMVYENFTVSCIVRDVAPGPNVYFRFPKQADEGVEAIRNASVSTNVTSALNGRVEGSRPLQLVLLVSYLMLYLCTLPRLGRRKRGRRGRARGPNIVSSCRFGAAVFSDTPVVCSFIINNLECYYLNYLSLIM